MLAPNPKSPHPSAVSSFDAHSYIQLMRPKPLPVPHFHLDAQPPGVLRLSPFFSSYLDAQPPTPRRRNRETSRIRSTSVLAGQGRRLDSPPPRSATSPPISLLAMLSAEPSSSTGDLVALAAGRREPPRMATGCTLKGWSCQGC
jgi:hypothetical protein